MLLLLEIVLVMLVIFVMPLEGTIRYRLDDVDIEATKNNNL
jgi:hypothetical protein